MRQHPPFRVQQVQLHRGVDGHHVQGQFVHALLVSLAVHDDQTGRLMFDHITRQPQVHALPGLQRGLFAVVVQQQDHRCTQAEQQRR